MAKARERGGPRGREADTPREIGGRGWKDIATRVKGEAKADNLPLLAAGVAYYAFLAIFPAIIALVTVYGLVFDPAEAQRQIEEFARALPQSSRAVLDDFLTNITSGSEGALSIGLVVSILAALWSASSGMSGLVKATNLAYDEDETRGFVKVRAISLALTLGGILFLAFSLVVVAAGPDLLERIPGIGPVAAGLIRWLRFPVLLVVVAIALAAVYRYAPDRDQPRFAWVSWGAGIATVLWVLGTLAFSLYVNNFSSYGATYGALAGVVVLLLWLFLSSALVLLGAEINAEMEAQTAHDTTRGPSQPMGERDARKANTVADGPDPARTRR